MNWKKLPAGIVTETLETFLTALGDDADNAFSQMRGNPRVIPRMAELCLQNVFQESTSQTKAKKIMGLNFFGIENAWKYFGATPSRRVRAYMSEIPFTTEQLEKYSKTHILFAHFPISYEGLCMATSQVSLPRGQRLFHKDNPRTRARSGPRENLGFPEWHLVRKTSVERSQSKSLSLGKKVAFEGNSDCLPKPMVLVYGTTGHFLATGERLFPNELVRTAKASDVGSSIVVGKFGPDGLVIDTRKNSVCIPEIGIASEVLPLED